MILVPAGDDVTITFMDQTDHKAREIQMQSMAWTDPLFPDESPEAGRLHARLKAAGREE